MIKQTLSNLWKIETHIRAHIYLSQSINKISGVGRYLSMIFDRILLTIYGIDLDSNSIKVKTLSIAHPSGVLLGGNGITSTGRVVIMAGVKFVGRAPDDIDYLKHHHLGNVFSLGDNVVIGANSTIIGPINICDNVIVGAMSLVNKNILEPGIYVGIPAKKISHQFSDQWVRHL